MPSNQRRLFENFLFDPFEGLRDLERHFQELSEAYPWVRQALAGRGKVPDGWLRQGLTEEPCAPWSRDFFFSVLQITERQREADFQRELQGKLAELAASLPPQPWKEAFFMKLLERVEQIHDEIDRAWAMAALANAVSRQGPRRWSATFFQEMLRLLRGIQSEEEKMRVAGHIADAFGDLGGEAWMPSLFESLVAILRSFRDEDLRLESVHLVSEQFLGFDRIRPELVHVPLLKHLALLTLTLAATNQPEFRGMFARRVHFVTQQIQGRYDIVPDSWEELLSACLELDDWHFEERDLQGGLRWENTPVAALLGLLGRDFSRAKNRGWVQRFFHRLSDRIFLLSPGRAREAALRQLLHGLTEGFTGNEKETVAWIQHILQRAESTRGDPSRIYEGVFGGFLQQKDLQRASASAMRIVQTELRDRAFRELALAWIEALQPQRAMSALYEISDASERGETALRLADTECVVQDPAACAMLFRAAASLPAVAQEVLRRVVQHPKFPNEARKAILDQAPPAPLSLFARSERLHELERLKEHLPQEIYLRERLLLLGLEGSTQPDPNGYNGTAENGMSDTPKIVVDRPHAYGDGLYLTPEAHIQKNHFGEEVAGSRFTAWEDFSQMWREIVHTVESRVSEEEGVQVLELEMPMDVGVTGVMSLSDAPPEDLSTEIRNGQPSIYCTSPEVRQPTRTLTIVVGPSKVGPEEIEGYEGHALPCVLYTVYPGKPAYPFPRCDKEDNDKLETSLQAAISLLKAGQLEEAKAVLYETYTNMEGSDESARYWSRHVLIH